MRYILFIILISIGPRAVSQDWFSKSNQGEQLEGYIITIAGDTIYGNIMYDYPVVMQKRISFTNKNNPDAVIYQPKDIRGYSCDNRSWVSSTVELETYNGSIKFNRFGILYAGNGPMQLIRIFPEKDKLVKKMSSAKAETVYNGISLTQDPESNSDLYIKKLEDAAENINSSPFKKDFITSISRKVSDNRELVEKINRKEYRFHDLLKIIDEYNRWFLQNRYNNSR